MTRWARRAFAALALLAAAARGGSAQDSSGTTRALALRMERLAPFHREYRMLVRTPDSTVVLGSRTLTLSRARYGGSDAWLLVETRGGVVPAVETLYVTPEGRPAQWSATLGQSRLAMAFARDSVFGATSGPAGRQNIVRAAPGTVVTSVGMLELLLPLVDWTPRRADTVSVLAIDQASGSLVAAELAVIGEERVAAAPAGAGDPLVAAPARDAWVVVLRAPGPHTVLLWVDREKGTLLRLQQVLPIHTGLLLEYVPVGPP